MQQEFAKQNNNVKKMKDIFQFVEQTTPKVLGSLFKCSRVVIIPECNIQASGTST